MRGYARRIGSWKARTNEQSNQRQNPGFEKILIPGFLKGGESGAHTIPFPHLRDSSLNNGPRKNGVCERWCGRRDSNPGRWLSSGYSWKANVLDQARLRPRTILISSSFESCPRHRIFRTLVLWLFLSAYVSLSLPRNLSGKDS